MAKLALLVETPSLRVLWAAKLFLKTCVLLGPFYETHDVEVLAVRWLKRTVEMSG